MKNLVAALIGIGIVLLFFGIASSINDTRCEDAWDEMDGLVKCIATPGCFFDAATWIEVKKSHTYYERSCTDHKMYSTPAYKGKQSNEPTERRTIP